jgi:hypothetical protein
VNDRFVLVFMLICTCLLIVSIIRLVRDLIGPELARRENERLRQALQWYASPDNWRHRTPDLTGSSPADKDHGAMARYALTGYYATKEGLQDG